MKTFAFDIDGTLLKKDGQLSPSVIPFFKNKNLAKCNLIFATGNTKKVINGLNKELKQNFPHLENIKPYYSSINGSIIYNPKGEIVYDFKLDKIDLKNKIDKILQEDKNAIIMYVTSNHYWIVEPKDEKLNQLADNFIEHEKNKGDIGMPFSKIGGTPNEVIEKLDDIYGLIVVMKNINDTYETLIKLFNQSEYEVYKDSYFGVCSVTRGTKWKSLKKIIEIEQQNGNNNNFPNKAEDIIFFGDGFNDVECLQKCNLSFARGINLEKEIVESAKYYVDDLTDVANKLLND